MSYCCHKGNIHKAECIYILRFVQQSKSRVPDHSKAGPELTSKYIFSRLRTPLKLNIVICIVSGLEFIVICTVL